MTVERKSTAGSRARCIVPHLGPVAILLGSLSASGCSVVLDSNANQCASSEDCLALGTQFGAHVCSDGICVLPTEASCASSQECIDLLGAPAMCRNGGCVPLTSQDCQLVVPQEVLGDDNTIFFGWMGPLQGDYESIGVPMERASELAFREILERANGIPGASGGTRHKLGLIACHDLDDYERTARHLIESVQVPGVIGPAFSGVTLSVATDVAIPAGALLMTASATTPAISELADDDLVWRTCPSDAIQAIPLAELVAQAESRIRVEQSLASTDAIRLATASKGDAYGQGLFDSLTQVLQFNSKGATDNGADFLPTTYADPSSQTVDFSSVVNDIVDFEPHIVLPLGTNEGVTDIMQGVEDAWPTVGTPPPRPIYLNDALSALSGSGSIDFDGASGSLDFDNALGEAEADIDIWCVVIDSQTSLNVFYSSGQYYDATLRQVTGIDGCY
jgi:ABC-type branched-subunit amino acid transport system substrate-binding protein